MSVEGLEDLEEVEQGQDTGGSSSSSEEEVIITEVKSVMREPVFFARMAAFSTAVTLSSD